MYQLVFVEDKGGGSVTLEHESMDSLVAAIGWNIFMNDKIISISQDGVKFTKEQMKNIITTSKEKTKGK